MIEYQRQDDPTNARLCGAACLSMVYRAFEMNLSQADIWPAIVKKNQFGSMAANTHLMAQDAMKRGFPAVAVQTSAPLPALRKGHEAGMQIILNHLLEPGKPAGHYSVLVDIDDQYIYLHDPFFGPNRRMLHAQFLDLWEPQSYPAEITGYVLIAIPKPGPEPAPKTSCPACKTAANLPPPELQAIFNICPACDHAWPFDGKVEPPVQRSDMSKVFSEMDKFASLILSMPDVARHPDVKVQLEAFARQKLNIQAAVTAFEESQKMRDQQMAAMEKSATDAKQNHDKKLAEMNTPMKPLDGRELGLALLKNLGFTARS